MDSNTATTSLATALVGAIRDASFPESEEVLSSPINESNIPPLLATIDAARSDLSETVRTVSRQEAGDVDGWIEQAKRVQTDIARCKEDARYIVQEHERIEALRNAQEEARNKSLLLEAEITFNETLEKQILLISETSIALSKVDNDIGQQQLFAAAQTLPSIADTINKIPGNQSRALLLRMHSDLEQRLSEELRRDLDERILTSSTHEDLSLQVLHESPEQRQSSEETTLPGKTSGLSLHQILESMSLLDLRDQAIAQISQRIDKALLPHLYRTSKLKITDTVHKDGAVFVALSFNASTTSPTISAVFEIVKCLHSIYPVSIRESLTRKLLSWIVPLLVKEWLNPAIPTTLEDLPNLNELQNLVEGFDAWLRGNGYRDNKGFEVWLKEVPGVWFSKRRILALDAVRTAFTVATGSTRLVDRVERQTVRTRDPPAETDDDDWAKNWEEDYDQESEVNGKKVVIKDDRDDESDAWGFDAEEQVNDESLSSTAAASGNANQDDEAEAWGWGDEDDSNAKAVPSKQTSTNEPNGFRSSQTEQKDIVLKESYSVTDIPDYILEQIGIDLTDNHRLRESPSTYFKYVATPLPDLGSLPKSTLAIFRAIATSSYQSKFSPPLSNMHIYNDVLYLASKLGDGSDDTSTVSNLTHPVLRSQVPALEKFARQVYTSEISTHRTIVLDLLDTAQGFVSCTRSPYAETCETAITSTIDYLRSLHSQWSPILSSSHLCQIVGNLTNGVMGKIIEDIEDMEDISEPESRKLVSLCEPVSALQDLFIAKGPTSQATDQENQEEEAMSTIAVHCSSYLRFQYLLQILESNLIEIRYLWTDAGLSLEFGPEEVVDLIQALFTESQQRRSAISTIKSRT